MLVLSDAYVAQRRQIRDAVVDRRDRAAAPALDDAAGRRRRASRSTASTRVNAFRVPGTPGGTYLAAGIEHTEEGNPTADARMHQQMSEKRFRKLDGIARRHRATGSARWAPTTRRSGIIAWGSTYGMLRSGCASIPSTACSCPRSCTRSRSRR